MTAVLVLGALAATLLAGWVTTLHPRVTLGAFALVLACVPYADVPGTDVPLLLVLAVGVWVALAFLPGVRFLPSWPEGLLLVLAGLAGLSVLATSTSREALLEYAAWLAVTAVAVPIRFLPDDARRSFVRVFVAGCALASLAGIALLRFDPAGLALGKLSFAGYSPYAANAQYVLGDEENALRLTGTYVEPNIAGLVLAVGLIAAVACFRGTWRVALVLVIGAGLTLTLSRSALATVAVAALLVALTGPVRRRLALLGAMVAAGAAALAVPVVRERLFNSFGPNDTGSLARELAFLDFRRSLEGHWWWGLGWDRDEFRDYAVGVSVNFVANTPLLTVYRGGAVLGGVAVLVLLLAVVRALLTLGRGWEPAVLGAGVIGFCLVALQLDFPVVIQHPATAVFSVLLGLWLGSLRPQSRVPREERS